MNQARCVIAVGGIVVLCAALVTDTCLAPPRKPKDAPKLPRGVATRPAAERDEVLKRIEERAKDVKTIAADFEQVVDEPIFNLRTTKTGSLKMSKPQSLRVVWKTPKPREEIVYDGKFFWEIKHGIKQIIHWTLNQNRAAGQGKPDLNVGPFQFLAGVKAEQVNKDYLAALVDDAKDTKTHHFLLVPLKAQERAEYSRLDVWIDRGSLLPVKVRFTKTMTKEEETWTLKNVVVNQGVKPSDFRVRVPLGWKKPIKDPVGPGSAGRR